MYAESIWKCDPYVSTPVVHALLDQASKTYSSSQYPSVSQSVGPFQLSKCFLCVNFKASVETISCFYPFIGIVPGERFVKAYKIKSAGCQYFHYLLNGLNL
jgi:hypothetical protein